MQNQEALNRQFVKSAAQGDTALVLALLRKGADIEAVDEDTFTALMGASWYGFIETVRVLLTHGAAIEAKDQHGNNSLILASCSGQTEVVRILLEQGAELEARNSDGNTPLTLAQACGHVKAAAFLESVIEQRQLLNTIMPGSEAIQSDPLFQF